MQISIAEQILVYPKEVQELRKNFLKRVNLESFKKISDEQIEKEYRVKFIIYTLGARFFNVLQRVGNTLLEKDKEK